MPTLCFDHKAHKLFKSSKYLKKNQNLNQEFLMPTFKVGFCYSCQFIWISIYCTFWCPNSNCNSVWCWLPQL